MASQIEPPHCDMNSGIGLLRKVSISCSKKCQKPAFFFLTTTPIGESGYGGKSRYRDPCIHHVLCPKRSDSGCDLLDVCVYVSPTENQMSLSTETVYASEQHLDHVSAPVD